MLNLSRRQAAWLFYIVTTLLVILFLLILWLFAMATTPTAEPFAGELLVRTRIALNGIV